LIWAVSRLVTTILIQGGSVLSSVDRSARTGASASRGSSSSASTTSTRASPAPRGGATAARGAARRVSKSAPPASASTLARSAAANPSTDAHSIAANDHSSTSGADRAGSVCRQKCPAAAGPSSSSRARSSAAATLLPVPPPPTSQKSFAASGSARHLATASNTHPRVPRRCWPRFSTTMALKSNADALATPGSAGPPRNRGCSAARSAALGSAALAKTISATSRATVFPSASKYSSHASFHRCDAYRRHSSRVSVEATVPIKI
jgi:hypothetical protein